MYRKAVTAQSPELPRCAATLGSKREMDSTPTGLRPFSVCVKDGFKNIRGLDLIARAATPVGVGTISHSDPRVAARRGNPGLGDVTALRYKAV